MAPGLVLAAEMNRGFPKPKKLRRAEWAELEWLKSLQLLQYNSCRVMMKADRHRLQQSSRQAALRPLSALSG